MNVELKPTMMTKKQKLSRRDFIKITAVAGSALVGGKLLFDLVKDQFVTVRETRLLMGTIINLAVVAENRVRWGSGIRSHFYRIGTPGGDLHPPSPE